MSQMARPRTGLNRDQLAELDDDTFGDYVADIAAVRDPGPWKHLLHPDVARRTRDTLQELLADLHRETTQQKAELTEPDYRTWSRTVRTPMEQRMRLRLAEARATVEHTERLAMRQERDAGRVLTRQLAAAIQRHRLAAVNAGFHPEPHDQQLWSVLSTLIVPFKDLRLTLDDLFGRGLWTLDDDAEAPPS